jgi:predicted outer membrane repeat protein
MIAAKVWRSSLCLALLAGTLAPGGPAHAAGVVGNGTPASCTEAAFTAALLGGGTVTFNCGGPATILLLSEKAISQDTTIRGGGVITLTGGLATRLFRVADFVSLSLNDITLDSGYSPYESGGAIYSTGSLALTNVTIQNSQTDVFHCGGAIQTYGRTIISDSRFKNNTAGYGGAICTQASQSLDVRITGSTFEGNRATHLDGGAIHHAAATLTVASSGFAGNSAQFGGALSVMAGATATLHQDVDTRSNVFTGNSATDSGGAIYSQGALKLSGVHFDSNRVPQDTPALGYGGAVASLGTLALADGRFSANQGRFGGGLFVGGNAGAARADITRTLFWVNSAAAFGGALYTNVAASVITVTHSSFESNSAVTSGGGVARSDGQLQIWDSSFRANTAGTGGGLYVGPGSSYVQVRSVTFADNEANNSRGGGVHNEGNLELYFTTIVSNTNGVLSTLGGNTRFRSSVLHNPGALNCDGDGSAQPSNDSANHISDNSCGPQFANQGDPLLGRLQLYDHFTSFSLPLPGSPLINAGYHTCPDRDQRGALRPNACDIGAVEFGGLLPRVFLPLLMWTK